MGMKRTFVVCLALAACLSGCGNWPYGGPIPQGAAIEPEGVELESPVPTGVACTQERTPVSLWEETELGVPYDVGRWVEGFHSSSLVWAATGARTLVTIDVWDLRATMIKSRTSAGVVAGNADRTCASYLELIGQAELATADGRLLLNGELTMRIYGASEAFGAVYFAWDALADYAPTATGRCFQGLELKVLLGDSGFSGSLTHDFTYGACDQPTDKHAPVLAARWGTRWQSY
jgi:hypothetical protein